MAGGGTGQRLTARATRPPEDASAFAPRRALTRLAGAPPVAIIAIIAIIASIAIIVIIAR